ncbi:zinc-ribbon domain-containing protein [Kordia sp. YSTF-M3]|uniref:Zinc-ribbon domain-containing protein n=1 Tax=Kordia aestuariivivens TaxID=2759037 RepID=A0ABR7Q7V8_9FLAO|nr:zinc-ribbon domain-containing protein [Kordia aestuariivivens]MBC8754635.1 zinc-ribbon domain-containing protein [Kordia aestuariivivens]
MIIYGGSSKDLGTRKLQGAKCPNCEATDIHAHAVVNYGTLFFIPLFPTNKKYSSICGNCDQVLTKKQMPQQMKDKLALEKHHFKSPLYLYAGVVIIALLIGFGIYTSRNNDALMAENIKHLEANDVIVFKEKSKEYSFAKVHQVRNDTIIVNYGLYTYEGGYSAPSESEFNSKKATVTDFYTEDLSFYLQSEIDSLYGNGDLVKIYK